MNLDSIIQGNSAVTVVGVFDQSPAAEQAFNELKSAGFTPDCVSVSYITSPSSLIPGKNAEDSEEIRFPILKVLVGASLGAILGWLLAGGSKLLNGFGPLMELGTMGAIILGIFLGILCSILISNNQSESTNINSSIFDEHINSSRTTVRVITSNYKMFNLARTIIKRNGAYGTRYIKS